MKVTNETVKKVASLSMFDIEDAELEGFRCDLEAILQHVERLNELDTDGVEPAAYVLDQQNIFRDDIPGIYGCREGLLRNAPHKEDGFFVVPKVVE